MGPWGRVHPFRPSGCSPDSQASVQQLGPRFRCMRFLSATCSNFIWLILACLRFWDPGYVQQARLSRHSCLETQSALLLNWSASVQHTTLLLC